MMAKRGQPNLNIQRENSAIAIPIETEFVRYCKAPASCTAASLIGQNAYDLVLGSAVEAHVQTRKRQIQYVIVAILASVAVLIYFQMFPITQLWAVVFVWACGLSLAIWTGKLLLAANRRTEPTVAELKAVGDEDRHIFIELLEEFRQRMGQEKGIMFMRDANGSERRMTKSQRRAFVADHGRFLIIDGFASGNWKFIRRFNRPNSDIYVSAKIGVSAKLFLSRDLLTMPEADYQRISHALSDFAQSRGGHSSVIGSRCLKAISYMREAALVGKTLTQTWSFVNENGTAISESEIEKLSSMAGHAPFNRFLSLAPLDEIL